MEVFKVLILHVTVFMVAGVVVASGHLAVRVVRTILRTSGLRPSNLSDRTTPVFTGRHPVLLRMEQGAAGSSSAIQRRI